MNHTLHQHLRASGQAILKFANDGKSMHILTSNVQPKKRMKIIRRFAKKKGADYRCIRTFWHDKDFADCIGPRYSAVISLHLMTTTNSENNTQHILNLSEYLTSIFQRGANLLGIFMHYVATWRLKTVGDSKGNLKTVRKWFSK